MKKLPVALALTGGDPGALERGRCTVEPRPRRRSERQFGREHQPGRHQRIDGDLTTRWSSAFSDPQTLELDLGARASIGQITLHWEGRA